MAWTTITVWIAFLLGLFAMLASSQVSSGASGVAFACLLGIIARIGQAERHHRELMKKGTPLGTPPV